MKIYIYLIISIIIYFYIIKNNIYTLSTNHHMYFWGTIFIILLIIYLLKYHKYHFYKFLQNINEVNKKPYY